MSETAKSLPHETFYMKLLITLFIFFPFVCSAQADTIYVLFEEKDSTHVERIRFENPNSKYPNDMMRSFHFSDWSAYFIHYSNLPETSDLSTDYFLANNAFLNNRNIYDYDFFGTASDHDLNRIFGGKDTIIYLSEKSHSKDGYYTFMRVYVVPFTKE